MIIHTLKLWLISIMLVQAIATSVVIAGSRFVETSPCSNAVKTCVGGSGTRTIEGFQVSRDCWEWAYVKTCNYPSKNDCRLYGHCYAVGDLGCLLQDSLGSCVNWQREFSCKSWDVVNKDNQTARMTTRLEKTTRIHFVQKTFVLLVAPTIKGKAAGQFFFFFLNKA